MSIFNPMIIALKKQMSTVYSVNIEVSLTNYFVKMKCQTSNFKYVCFCLLNVHFIYTDGLILAIRKERFQNFCLIPVLLGILFNND